MASDLIGRTLLGKLRVVRQLGEGGAGRVYEVEHLVTKHRRALKIIREELCLSGEAIARLVREAAAAARIDSPRVADTLDAGRLEDGRAYILMQLCEGRSLRSLLAEQTRLPEARALEIAREVALALGDVHRAGMVHRDIKPENIMLSDDESTLRLLDFGLCKLLSHDPEVGETLTREGTLAGTPAYMAPEQFDAGSDVDARADIWALGVVLFEMVSGSRPFTGKTAAAIASEIHRAAAPPLPSDADAGADTRAAVARALERDPALRFSSAGELLRALGGEVAPSDRAVIDERWQIVRELGHGGSATVFEVTDATGGPARAVKLLSKASKEHGDSVRRMLREAKLARELGKEHVVDVLESGFDRARDRHYLVMELCDGETLSQRIERGGALASDEALSILRPLAATLDAVHARDVVHRDVKPANVMVGVDGRPRLLDFGIAKAAQDGEQHTASDVILGTPLYMAPEQAQSEHDVGPAADRYALGQLAFTLLVGRAYFDRDSKKGLLPLLGAIGRGALERASERAASLGGRLPSGFDPWFRKATAQGPRDRFASATEQIDALSAALPERTKGSRVAVWALGLTAVAGAIAASVVLDTAEPASAKPTADTLGATPELIAPPASTTQAPSALVTAAAATATASASTAAERRAHPAARPSASSSARRPPDSLF